MKKDISLILTVFLLLAALSLASCNQSNTADTPQESPLNRTHRKQNGKSSTQTVKRTVGTLKNFVSVRQRDTNSFRLGTSLSNTERKRILFGA